MSRKYYTAPAIGALPSGVVRRMLRARKVTPLVLGKWARKKQGGFGSSLAFLQFPEITRDRMNAVLLVIAMEPLRFNMNHWFRSVNGFEEHNPFAVGEAAPSCGTVACLAGWLGLTFPTAQSKRKAEILSRPALEGLDDFYLRRDAKLTFTLDAPSWEIRGKATLRLPAHHATKLFYPNNWPADYTDRLVKAEGPKKRLLALRSRLQYYLETGK